MITKSLLFYIGCGLIPTPPSPCPDFGGQFLLVVIIGLLSPRSMVRPIYHLFHGLGNWVRRVFSGMAGIGIVVRKIDELFQRWFRFLKKERQSENPLVNHFYRLFLREDLVERIIFGYFVTIVLGSLLMTVALFL